MENNHNKQQIDKLIDGFRLIDDTFMNKVFQGNIDAVELILRIVLKIKGIVVESPIVQKTMINPETGGKDIAFDIYARDNSGKRYDIEMQRSGGVMVLKKRGRFYSATLDHTMLKAGEDYRDMKDSYVIMFMEEDYFKGNKPIYVFERVDLSTGKRFEDGNHIIYVNCAYNDSSTEIGRLVHDLLCTNAGDMYYDVLRKSVAYYKHDERGRAEMCKEVEEYAKDYAKEYAKEYAEEYAKEYRKQAEEAKENEAKAKENEAKAKVNEAKAKENEAKAKENEAKMKQKFDDMIKNAVRKKRDQDMTDKEIRTFLMDAYDLSDEEADAYIKGVQ
ncbi:MAG: PD-(D/E)XK nuclease family transposase [Sharpea porci]|uniref:PD-(D/E)XK nuclease family transposase n=1 Tax=Sharpea porci TaxID=2652286 RepID=UPI0024095E52|nr:PD-(D/E)XK nuclease family transposase [Sharpea porci]MDD6711385.1 PD-(D/E)XK nuclease family transposase [Sharpea porci]